MARKLLLTLIVILFLAGCIQKSGVPKVEKAELKEKWEGVGVLVTAEGFKDNFIANICPSIQNYAILGSYVIAETESYRTMDNYYVEYEKPTQYEFFVGKIAKGKSRVEMTYEDFNEINKVDEFPYAFYFLVRVKDADFEEVEKRLETTEIIFYNEEGKYLKVNLTPVIHKPSPVLSEPFNRHFETFLNEDNYYQFVISGGCGPFVYPWSEEVEVSVNPPEDITMKILKEASSGDITILDDNRFAVNIEGGKGTTTQWKVRFKRFGNFTVPIKLKWDNYEKTYEVKFIVEEIGVTEKVI